VKPTFAKFAVKEVLWADLPIRDPHGHEQEGHRPVIVVSVPEDIEAIPYRVLHVVPVTKTALSGVLFPTLAAGVGGLPLESTALIFQTMVLDVRRVSGRLGVLNDLEFAPIRTGLQALFGAALEVNPQP
jgi:mRNA interferase MazF